MTYGVPLLRNRVSPRCTIADSVMVVECGQGRLQPHRIVQLEEGDWLGLIRILLDNQVETLVTGGLDRQTGQMLESYGLSIVDNVACTAEQLLEAVACDKLTSGYGFSEKPTEFDDTYSMGVARNEHAEATKATWPKEDSDGRLIRFDCLACRERVCLRGQSCCPVESRVQFDDSLDAQAILDVARDVSSEDGRQLCRVAELVYFCLEMKFKRIGVAFCIDLIEPAGVLTGLLRRFFDVFPVSCKVGGMAAIDPTLDESEPATESTGSNIACNPTGQAEILNRLNTDMNIIAGLCMGVDCLFSQASKAPVTTLFVKDKSLVNNPIGAIYSDYYLNEVTGATASAKIQNHRGGMYI